jgi:selenocysteine lyase/cysteine desulfurase
MREHFHVPDNYFLSHSVGCLPQRTEALLKESYFEPWKSGQNWADWMPLLDKFRHGLSQLLGLPAHNICPQTNISSALTKIIFSLPQKANRKTILLSEQDFPTIGFVLKQAEKAGYRLEFIQGDPRDASVWAEAMDDTTAIVHLTHALSNTSHLLPVQEVCDLAREKGIISIIDIAQSFGALPIAAASWNPDFITGTGVKFLCCGPGACFLYASLEMQEVCEPIDVGWFSHENPFEMDIQNFQYAKDAMKFFGGTPSPAPLASANAALGLWQEIGLKTAHAVIDNHLTLLVNNIPDDILVSPRESGKRGATLVINPKDRAAFQKSLNAHNTLHDERREGFRFSMHGYTSEEEVKILDITLNNALS